MIFLRLTEGCIFELQHGVSIHNGMYIIIIEIYILLYEQVYLYRIYLFSKKYLALCKKLLHYCFWPQWCDL